MSNFVGFIAFLCMICAVVMAAATPGDIAAIPVEHLLKIGMILAALAVLLSRSWKPRAY